jgi:HD-GYP domain-containing protein (c-di-GMP phosphodiesterase class II)
MIVDAKSSFTSQHSGRVTNYCQHVARSFDFDEQRLTDLRRASLLHDIGKLGVPTGILEKPGRLEPEEFERIKLHTKFGHSILGRIQSFGYLAEIASAHHERLDGKGYWRGRSGDQLSLDVRIVTVCDVFDALSSKRPYREAMPLDKVWEIMDKDIGTAFDASCLRALKEAVNQNQLTLA